MQTKMICKQCKKQIGSRDPRWLVEITKRIPTKRGIRKVTRKYGMYCYTCGLNKKVD